MRSITYRVLFREEEEGGYTAIVPSLPGCISYGETLEEAILMVKEAIDLYIESLKAHNEEIPNEERTLEYNIQVDISA